MKITNLNPNEIFVFGSNLAGKHGKGAARDALKFGAIYGEPYGRQGQTYAIPTKDKSLNTLNLDEISYFVELFIKYANCHPELIFLLTPIGCGLAGLSPSEVAPLFVSCPFNVILPEEFKNEITEI